MKGRVGKRFKSQKQLLIGFLYIKNGPDLEESILIQNRKSRSASLAFLKLKYAAQIKKNNLKKFTFSLIL